MKKKRKIPIWKDLVRIRLIVQSAFFALVVYLGFLFSRFIRYYETAGASPYESHPNGVEGFLPIGALTSLKYWIVSGDIHPTHPAALFIFVAALSVSLLLRKSFCGWICPVGTISERLHKLWKKIFKKNIRVPRYVDIVLRSLKYIVLGFFLWAIVLNMPVEALRSFLDGDYWKISDIKMFFYFADISALTLVVIGILILLSLPIRNFWCRYLCPYGALTGILGMLSPLRVTRDETGCTSCKKCARNCPYHLPVDVKPRIISAECTTCLTCVAGCPHDALSVAAPFRRFRLPVLLYPVLILVVFWAIIGAAQLSGHWKATVSDADYRRLVPQARTLRHP